MPHTLGFHALLRWLPLLLAALLQLPQLLRHDRAIADVFHLGEFVAPAMTILQPGPSGLLPYTIHGGVDYLPFLLMTALGADETRVMSFSFVIAQNLYEILPVVLALLLAIRLVGLFRVDPLAVMPFVLLANHCLTFRDIFFLLSLYLFTFLVTAAPKGGRGPIWIGGALGLVSAIGVYWSFDRGLATVAAIGLPVLVLGWVHRVGLVAAASFVLGVLLLPVMVPGIGLLHHVENLRLLLRTSALWRYETVDMGLVALALAVNGMAALALGFSLLVDRKDLARTLILLSLGLAAAVFLRMGLNRVDPPHVAFTLWAPLLVLGLATRTAAPARALGYLLVGLVVFLLAAVVAKGDGYAFPAPGDNEFMYAALLFALFLTMAVFVPQRGAGATGLAALPLAGVAAICATLAGMMARQADPALLRGPDRLPASLATLPPDRALVDEGMLWLADQIVAAGAECVFDMANMGVLNGLTRLPACTQYTYPVYAGPQDEQRLIAQLEQAAPPVVVYRSDFWSYAIDGKPMTQRFPALDAHLLQAYPNEVCNLGHCLRLRAQ